MRDNTVPADRDTSTGPSEAHQIIVAVNAAREELYQARELLQRLERSSQQLNRIMALAPLVERIERISPLAEALERSVNLRRLVELLEQGGAV